TAQMYHVITTKHAPYHVCGAQQDNSTLCVGSNTTFGRGGGGGGGRGVVVDPYQVGGGEPGYIAPDPKDPDVFYSGANNGSDLTRHDPKTMTESGGPITHDMNSPEVYATVFSIGAGKTDVNVIWTGSDDGVVHVTRDGGKTWANVTPKEMPDLGRVSQIDAS